MSYKFYGRLIGKISTGAEALIHKSPSDTTTPFKEQAPGTKFMAYGEDSTSLAFNRALGALSSNIDSLSSILGAPALRSEMLRTASAGSAANFQSLDIDPTDTSGKIELGGGPNSGVANHEQPLQWIFCGIKKSDLRESTKLFHVDREAVGTIGNSMAKDEPFAGAANPESLSNYSISPVDCYENNTADSFFADQSGTAQEFTYGGENQYGSLEDFPLTLPPIKRVSTNAAPYSGMPYEGTAFFWDTDGLYIKDKRPDQLGLRPGVYIEIQNSGDQGEKANDGLYKIERIITDGDTLGSGSGSKLILSTGNLSRITVEDGAPFTSGEFISWQSSPDHAVDSSGDPGWEDRDNFAHIMYKVARPDISATAVDLYISNSSGPDFFKDASGQSKKFNNFTITQYIMGMSNYGDIGLADQEEGAEQNTTIPTGTLLYNGASNILKGSGAGAAHSVVTAAVPAGTPVVFMADVTPGQYFPCNPPGFLLNPVFEFEHRVLPGNNFLWVKSLTTVREQLLSQTLNFWDSAEDAKAEPYQTRQDVIATEILLNHIHYGGVAPSLEGSDYTLQMAKTPTAQILAPSLLTVEVENTNPGQAENFSAACNTAALVAGRGHIKFISSGSHPFTFIARLINAYDHTDGSNKSTLIISDVTRFDTTNTIGVGSLAATTWYASVGGVPADYQVTAIHSAQSNRLGDAPNPINPNKGGGTFTPSFGLNAAFHAHFSASEAVRGEATGYGNIIFVPGGTRHPMGMVSDTHHHRPFTTVLEGLEPDEIGHLISSSQGRLALIQLISKPGGLTVPEELASVGFDVANGDGSLTFRDVNTLDQDTPNHSYHEGRIPFSDNKTSAEGPTHGIHNLRDLPHNVRDKSILGALESALMGGEAFGDTDLRGDRAFGMVSNGVLWGAEVYGSWNHQDDLNGGNSKSLTLGGSNGPWTGTGYQLAISEAYIVEHGAKNYVPPQTIDLQEMADLALAQQPNWTEAECLITWSITTQQYEAHSANSLNSFHPGTNFPDSKHSVFIARVGLDLVQGEPSWIQDNRFRIQRLDRRSEIYVGRNTNLGGSQFDNEHDPSFSPEHPDVYGLHAQGGMHFPNIGAALAAIGTWNRNAYQGRSWTIKVVGPTIEAADPRRNISFPYKLPCDSITIEGLGGTLLDPTDHLGGMLEVKPPVISVLSYDDRNQSLFDINAHSDVKFSNLSIMYIDKGPQGLGGWATSLLSSEPDTAPGNNVFMNTPNAKWNLRKGDLGVLGTWGRTVGFQYPENPALQRNILIEDVHVSGPHGFFFFHGRTKSSVALNNNNDHNSVAFDGLTINRCTQKDTRHGFVQIAPSNALMSLQYGDQHAHDRAQNNYPYYWTNVSITNCSTEGPGIFDILHDGNAASFANNMEIWEESLWLDAIHLAACKEVVVRDCVVRNHLKGIVLGPGNASHYSSGVIENNTIENISTDAVVAISDSDISGISIKDNTISSWGIPFLTDLGWGPLKREVNNNAANENKFAAIRIAGNEFHVDGNSMLDTTDSSYVSDFANGFKRTHTLCINMSMDLKGSPYPPEYHVNFQYGHTITNNSANRRVHSGCFITSYVPQSENLTITGNKFRLSLNQDPVWDEIKSAQSYTCHPFHELDVDPDSWHTRCEDPLAIQLPAGLHNCVISGNILDGHVMLGNCYGVSFTDNNVTMPTGLVYILDSTSVTFSNNKLDNGTLLMRSANATIVNNDFTLRGPGAKYLDVYWTNSNNAKPIIYPGIKVDLISSFESGDKPSCVISGNRTTQTPSTVYAGNGTPMMHQSALELPAGIEVTSDPNGTNVVISNNIMKGNGFIKCDISANTVINGNIVQSDGNQLALEALSGMWGWFVDEFVSHSAVYKSAGGWPHHGSGSQGMIHGWSGLSINNNVFEGDVLINGCHGEFVSFNHLWHAFHTGNRQPYSGDLFPLDGNSYKWGERDPDVTNAPSGLREMPWTHNRFANVAVQGNTIFGNVQMLGLNDVTFTTNRLPGWLKQDHHYSYWDTDSRGFFVMGQLEMLSCKRVNVSNCKMGSVWAGYSSLVRIQGTHFGCDIQPEDQFGRNKLRSIGTYAPVADGRIVAVYTNHLSITNCDLKDATADYRPKFLFSNYGETIENSYHSDDEIYEMGISQDHNSYMNNPSLAVYSSQPPSQSASMSGGQYNDGVPHQYEHEVSTVHMMTWTDVPKNLKNVVLESCQAATISGCHIGQVSMVACDDAKISGNRFYAHGYYPSGRYNLKINDSSMRPCIQDNHFTASIWVGDPGSWNTYQVVVDPRDHYPITQYTKSATEYEYDIKLESIVRMPVHAIITGNRFDSAMGPSHDSWRYARETLGVPHGLRYGCGNIKMFNYGGSLIQGNHMMRGDHGYMMEANSWLGSAWTHFDWASQRGYSSNEEGKVKSRWDRERKDYYNRIGGRILLDEYNTFNPLNYTKGAIFHGLAGWDTNLTDKEFETRFEDDQIWATYDKHQILSMYVSWLGRGAETYHPHDSPINIIDFDNPTGGLTMTADGTASPAPETDWYYMVKEDGDGNFPGYDSEGSHVRRYMPWGGVFSWDWFATPNTIYSNAKFSLNMPLGGEIDVYPRNHFPKTLGCFVMGNICKDVVMDERLKNGSWAFGKRENMYIDGQRRPHLPAEAYETSLNPQHAENHANFNMLRTRKQDLSLSRIGNLGQLISRASPTVRRLTQFKPTYYQNQSLYGLPSGPGQKRYRPSQNARYRINIGAFARLAAPIESNDFRFEYRFENWEASPYGHNLFDAWVAAYSVSPNAPFQIPTPEVQFPHPDDPVPS